LIPVLVSGKHVHRIGDDLQVAADIRIPVTVLHVLLTFRSPTGLRYMFAADFTLVSQFGQPMSPSEFRGKVVLLSFDDAPCTTVCPLTTQEMLQGQTASGCSREDVRLLGVDANPGATSTADVMACSRGHHGMQREPDLVIGGQQQAQHDGQPAGEHPAGRSHRDRGQ
jgi:SCO1/SenC